MSQNEPPYNILAAAVILNENTPENTAATVIAQTVAMPGTDNTILQCMLDGTPREVLHLMSCLMGTLKREPKILEVILDMLDSEDVPEETKAFTRDFFDKLKN